MYTSPPPSCAPELGQHTLLHVSHTAHAAHAVAHAPRDPADSKKAQQVSIYTYTIIYMFICLCIQGSTEMTPVDHMIRWIFVLVQKDSNARKEN
jgi:hypothetical protein